ncbi:MAG TPA: TetR family transcriptional regulator [Pseudonocardia sp.]|jgi:AcrR family transcriptional regulator|uniref:TetR family transcriptional regulator n=1 Tax=Pseudonocardia sp. TaxID=60912 RepID=UPI002B4AEB85|nr:TetR family transcriptional regulator [Pseudonocardia sp.]HLU54466.1 TetR family transcriptional regulator [Pseudonocardia sp.]
MSRPKSRRELYSEATRAALLETATAMFAERGYARTSLDDIAVATQVTRGAVYHHFESKQAVFEAVFDAQEKDVTQRVAAAAAGQPNAWEAGMAALDAFLDLCCEDRYGRLCWLEGPIALGWARWMDYEQKYAYALIDGFLAAARAEGLLAPVPAATSSTLVFHLLGGAGRMIAEAPPAERRAVRDECATTIRRMLNGLRA